MSTDSTSQFVKDSSWRALQIFSFYRLILSATLVVLINLQLPNNYLGSHEPEIFKLVSISFLIFSLFSHLATYYHQSFDLQTQIQVLVDILLITILMYASGGVSSGLGMLMAVSTTAATILISRPSALGYSVLAATAVFVAEAYANLNDPDHVTRFTQMGILTVTLLATGLLAFYLSRRIRESERKAEQSIRGLASMEKLNEEIIQYMSTGVIVIDGGQRIRLINRAAWVHLGMPESTQSKRLEHVATPLSRQLNLWRRKKYFRAKEFRNTASGPSLLPHFSPIGESKENAIIFLDDTSVLTQQAQNLKLASLGRLTASIAHEIRNPLGALSHAAQLLKESDGMDTANLYLVQMVEKNAARVNEIIENIMQLSVTKKVQIDEINLSGFLGSLASEYLVDKDPLPKLSMQFQSENIIVHFDISQLRQILTNLYDNGVRYSQLNTGVPTVQIMVGIEPQSRSAFLDVIDKGEGIPPETASKIFEPFYTTSRTGTGLGLYLSRELCEANQARLDYIPLTAGGSCFRISFSTNRYPTS